MKKAICILTILISHCGVSAQTLFTNTLEFDEKTTSPDANLSDIHWIQGHWRGEAFGGITEEVWTPPLGNSMMCAFKLIVKDEIQFYELVTISKENGTLMMRLKHFDSKMRGWEAIKESIDFKLVKITDNKIYFDEFTFEKVSDNEITIYVVIENKGFRKEVPFRYVRFKE